MPIFRPLSETKFINDANLVAYYPLEGTTDIKGGFNLTNENSVAFSAAKFSNGADFGTTNSNKRLVIANDLGIAGNGNQSYSCWIKANAEPGTGVDWRFIDHRDGGTDCMVYMGYQDSSGTKRLYGGLGRNGVADYIVYKTVTLGTSLWYHVVVTYDGSNVRVYFNGEYVGAAAGSGTGSGLDDGFSIGSTANGYLYSSMMVDDVAVFSRALSSAEVNELYQGMNTGAFLQFF